MLNKKGLIGFTKDNHFFLTEEIIKGKVGWFPANIDQIARYQDSGIIQILNNDSSAQLLVTPPEIGLNGLYGVSSDTISPFNKNALWLISSDVTDDKLKMILKIFNAFSFDNDIRQTPSAT